MATSVGPDGIDVPGLGWTPQSSQYNSNKNLQSYPAANSVIIDPPTGNGYGAWTLIPEDALTSNAHTSTSGYLMRFVVPANFSCGHLDMIATAAPTSVTNAVFALYSAASFATGPLVWSANLSASFSAAGVITATWGGTSSPSSYFLQGGQTYWVYYELTYSGGISLAASTGATATSMNPNLTASASFANNAMSLASSAPTSLTATTTLTPQTTWANSAVKTWFGLRA